VPVVTVDSWGVPTALLPTYQAAGSYYGIPWTVLAAINKVETDFGRNVSVSSAGAEGWMQFMPATWDTYGTDASGDGLADPYDPSDAIFAAARYLAAAGGARDIRRAVFAYNHAGWYVDSVMRESAALAAVPQPLVDALTALTQGRVPVLGAFRVRATPGHRGAVVLTADRRATVLAPTDARVVDISGSSDRGYRVTLEDPEGNRFGFDGLGTLRRAALRRGMHVFAGTVLGRLRPNPSGAGASATFTIRSAGRVVDPLPVIRGWRERERAAHRGSGAPPSAAARPAEPAPGSALLLGKERLRRRVLADRRITLPSCGRRAIAAGAVDVRVLDTLALLADAGLRPTVSRLACTTPGIASVEFAAFAGVPLAAPSRGPAVARRAVQQLERLQGLLAPARISSGPGHVVATFTDHPHAPGRAVVVQAAADRLDRLGVPYVLGGGHVTPTPAAPTGLDCSSSVSWVLQRAGLAIPTMTSTDFMGYGDPGPGRYVTIYANAGHVFMSIGGRFFGTSGFGHPAAGTGPHWFVTPPSAGYLAGFTQRHPHGL
jgi:cell wall-associated NlpC family hydrolase